MALISGRPTLFGSARSTALFAACVVIVSLGILPPALGRVAAITFGNRVTLMLGFGCVDIAWTTWPSTPPRGFISTTTRPTLRGTIDWLPALRTTTLAAPGPTHRALSLPFWVVLLPAAAWAGFSTLQVWRAQRISRRAMRTASAQSAAA